MLRLDKEDIPRQFKLFIWFLMAFQAGYINVGGFIVFGNFVSHVTGTSSQIGMGIASIDWNQILTFLSILIAFIVGAGFAGHFIGRRKVEGQEPKFILVTAVKAVLFGLVLIISEQYYPDYSFTLKLLLIIPLSLACGIQNATCSLATNGFLKPTHMTGLSTDIGINLFRVSAYKKNSNKFKLERHNNRLRMGILTSFISGGSIAFFIFGHNGHYGFLFPFLSSLAMLFTSIISESSQKYKMTKLKWAHSSILGVFLTTLLIGLINIINS